MCKLRKDEVCIKMKSLAFTCIFLCTLAQGQGVKQTTWSIDLIYFSIKDWLLKTFHSNINDGNINNGHEVSTKTIKRFNNTINNNSNAMFTPVKEVNTKELEPTSEITNKINSNQFNGQINEINNRTCTNKNERYPVPGICDRYIQCRDGRPEETQCPDGLRYNHNVKSNINPCQYPVDVQCAPGSSLQPPKSNEVCPNQFGYFKTEDHFNCSSFRICENGIGYDYNCPVGLAFNKLTYRCDWPDRVPECNVDALNGYRCPEVPNIKNINVTRSYRSPKDCRIYFSCINQKPRRLECDEYFAFDELSQTCVPANKVADCSDEQRSKAFKLVRQNSDGEYVSIRDFDNYIVDRAGNLDFTPVKKRPKII